MGMLRQGVASTIRALIIYWFHWFHFGCAVVETAGLPGDVPGKRKAPRIAGLRKRKALGHEVTEKEDSGGRRESWGEHEQSEKGDSFDGQSGVRSR